MNAEDRSTRAVNFIRFHGLTLLVVEHGGIEYVPAKPFTELACVDWKGAKRALTTGDSAVLYGTRVLLPPEIRGAGGASSPRPRVYIRLDRAHMYLARINTNQMRVQGNAAGADQLLALQIEWAEALHRYETQGMAVKAGRAGALRELHQLARTRALLSDPRERQALTALLHAELEALGLPVDTFEPAQGTLPLGAAARGARHG